MRLFLVALFALAAMLGVAQSPSEKKLKQLEKSYLAAKSALEKKPKDKKVRDQFVTAGVKFGHESMVSPDLGPRIKYKQALRVYKEVLKVDPKNEVARKETDLIVSIYKQMGRPIPD
ncbi:MAG: hypothetical protein ACO1SV_17545 [Fimbriimonas sp.]